jgi:hypothetical protein
MSIPTVVPSTTATRLSNRAASMIAATCVLSPISAKKKAMTLLRGTNEERKNYSARTGLDFTGRAVSALDAPYGQKYWSGSPAQLLTPLLDGDTGRARRP